MNKKRILSGMRPSGKLHIGHLYGALNNWVKLQEENECLYMVADWHALTTDYADTSNMINNIEDMVLDWIAAGINAEKSIIFRQSDVIEHAELFLLLSMVTPIGWLLRCPTYKEQLKEIKDKDLHNLGFLGYPVLQSADILIYKANAVPVGEDQLPHLELTREICRRFNNFYGSVFPEPQGILTKSPRVPGIDGRKMSKSYGNSISISEDPDSIRNKVQQMFTDPKKVRASDPGHPAGCIVYSFHEIYNTCYKIREKECLEALTGCVACKKQLAEMIVNTLAPLREKRQSLGNDKSLVSKILEDGKNRAKEIAVQTMMEVRKSIKLK